MPTPTKGPRLGKDPAHQRQLLANLANHLFEADRRHDGGQAGAITTTEARAKALRPYAERLITKARRGSVHDRRQVMAKLRDRAVTSKLFDDIAPRYTDRPGGYLRILKLGPRHGDNAPMARVELV